MQQWLEVKLDDERVYRGQVVEHAFHSGKHRVDYAGGDGGGAWHVWHVIDCGAMLLDPLVKPAFRAARGYPFSLLGDGEGSGARHDGFGAE
jgi:hypothetical protein